LEEASDTVIFQRNKGLGHEPLSLDHDTLLQGLHTDLLPASQDYAAIYTLGQHSLQVVPQTAIILNRVGEALLRLCFYKDAINYFKQALQDIQDTANLPNTVHPRTKIDQYKLDSMGVTQPTAICLDMTKRLFGIDTYELALTKNLLSALLLTGELEDAYNLAYQLLNKIDPNKLEKYKTTINNLAASRESQLDRNRFLETLNQENPELLKIYGDVIEYIKNTAAPFVVYYPEDSKVFNSFSTIFGYVAYAYCQKSEYQKATELYEQALKLSGSKDNATSILNNLARSYNQLGNKEQAERYANSVIEEGDLLDQFLARVLKCNIQLDKNNPEIDQEIEALRKVLAEKKGEFKELMGDRFWLCQLELCELELRLSALKKSSYDVIELQIKTGLKIIQNWTKTNRFAKEALVFHCHASRALSNLFGPTFIPSTADQILQNAEDYFNKGTKQTMPSQLLIQKATASDLAAAYSNYVVNNSRLPFNKRIEFLEKAKSLQENYGIETHTTNLNLGYEHHNHAETFYKEKKYNKAIPQYQKAIVTLEPLLSQNHPETLKVLAMSYERLGDCKKDVASLEKARDLYFEFLKKYNNHSEKMVVKSYIEDILRKIFKMNHLQQSWRY